MKRTWFRFGLVFSLALAVLVPKHGWAIPLYSASGRLHDWKDFGCHMSPGAAGAPPSGANQAGGNQAFCSACQSANGIPRWWIDDNPYENLWMSDTPLSYTMSSGQEMSFRFIYKQRYKLPHSDEIPNLYVNHDRVLASGFNPYDAFMRTFGMTNASWSHNWMMDMIFWDRTWETNGNSGAIFSHTYEILLYRPDGGMQYFYNLYPSTNSFSQPSDALTQVTVQPLSGLGYPVVLMSPSHDTNGIYWGDPGVGFEIIYPDGSQDIFNLANYQDIKPGPTVEPTDDTAHAFLTQRIDPQGRATLLGYERLTFTNYGAPYAAFRVKYVVDPDGRTNTFKYATTGAYSAWQLSEVDDPYGRKAQFQYAAGVMSSTIDAASNTNSFGYQGANGWITNLTTPYGTTSFYFYQHPDTNQEDGFFERAVWVQEPENAQQLFYFVNQDSVLGTSATPPTVPGITDFDSGTNGTKYPTLDFRNTLHWGRPQFTVLSSGVLYWLTNNPLYGDRLSNAVYALSAADMKKASLKHWLLGQDGVSITESLSSECEPSPDTAGATGGERVWYDYSGKPSGEPEQEGNAQVDCVARLLPDGTSQYGRYDYSTGIAPAAGLVWRNQMSYSGTSGVVELTNWFQYGFNNIDLASVSNSLGQQMKAGYNTNHQPIYITNSLNQVTSLGYGANHNLTSLSLPSGQSATFGLNSQYQIKSAYLLPEGRAIGISNYTAGLPSVLHATGTGLPDLWLTNTWDALNRLVNTTFTDGTSQSNYYVALSLNGHKDRLGNWSWFGFDGLEHLTSIADPRNNTNYLQWCSCGSLESITDPLNNQTQFFYNNQELPTNILFADTSSITGVYDGAERLIAMQDGAGRAVQFGYNNQGSVTTVSNAYGRVLQAAYDGLDRPITLTDANGVSVTNQFDLLNRLTARTWQDGFGETFVYSAQGLVAYTNRDNKWTLFTRDPRIIGITNANGEVVAVTNNALDELTDLWDGRTNHVTWHFNQYGWLTNKVDALNREIVRYTRDPNGQITNRLTPQFGNTAYAFDPAGNLTNITYANSLAPSVSLAYDALNRLVGMGDGVGSHTFNYTAASQLQTELGPWANDGVTNSYAQHLRTALALAQPSGGAWSQSYGYDSAWRLTSLASPAGSFGYGYNSSPSALVRTLSLPNGAWETNHFDSLARMDFTALVDHWGHVLDGSGYIHDPLGLRTNITRYLGMTTNSVAAGYDKIGQITSWKAYESGGAARQNEQLAWAYDKSDNLQYRTNGTLAQTFTADGANELTGVTRTGNFTVSGATPAPATNITVNGQTAAIYGDMTFAATSFVLTNGLNSYTVIARNIYGTNQTNVVSATLPASVTLQWDLNGNLTNDGTRTFVYDAENRLVTNLVASAWKTEFVYDGLGRRRIERDYGWTGSWAKTNELHFIYDGWLLVQVRDGSNNVLVTYTRGLDLSGSVAGAGGIGGLLARTDGNGSAYFHSDGSGNITALIDSYQLVQARYEYNPFGRLVAMQGPLGPVNEMQFSSMPVNRLSGMPHSLGRDYGVDWQGWLTRDPSGEWADANLYRLNYNNPLSYIDPNGMAPQWVNNFGDWELDRLADIKHFFVGDPGQIRVPDEGLRAGTGLITPLRDKEGNDVTADTLLEVAGTPLLAALGGPEREGLSLFGDAVKCKRAAKLADEVAQGAQETGTILWSGPGAKDAATWLANNTGGTTLEMTQLGAQTELATIGMDYLTQARPIWEAASKQFVQQASGDVRIVLSSSANPSSIYFTTEWKALLQNPNVTSVNFIHIP